MKQVLDKTIITKLHAIFSKEKKILAVYLFGSQARGVARKESDLDLAFMVSNRNNISEREIIKKIYQDISLPSNLDVSCVDLSSSPLFLHQIIKNGICIYEKNPYERTHIEATILNIYFDNQHIRNIYQHYLKKSLESGTYGYR